MTAYYSVIRFVPDPVADESINIGIAAFSGSTVQLLFAEDFERARL